MHKLQHRSCAGHISSMTFIGHSFVGVLPSICVHIHICVCAHTHDFSDINRMLIANPIHPYDRWFGCKTGAPARAGMHDWRFELRLRARCLIETKSCLRVDACALMGEMHARARARDARHASEVHLLLLSFGGGSGWQSSMRCHRTGSGAHMNAHIGFSVHL